MAIAKKKTAAKIATKKATVTKKIVAKKPATKKPVGKSKAMSKTVKIATTKAKAAPKGPFAIGDLVKFPVKVLGSEYAGVARVAGFTKDTLDLKTLPFPQQGQLVTGITISMAEAKAAGVTKVTEADFIKAGVSVDNAGGDHTLARISTALS